MCEPAKQRHWCNLGGLLIDLAILDNHKNNTGLHTNNSTKDEATSRAVGGKPNKGTLD
jgi:hypothetical protein